MGNGGLVHELASMLRGIQHRHQEEGDMKARLPKQPPAINKPIRPQVWIAFPVKKGLGKGAKYHP